MSGTSGYPGTPQWDEMPEEAMARAEEQLSSVAGQADGLLANYGWLIFIGAVIAIVGLMLLYLAGRSRKDRVEHTSDQHTPLFDEITDDTLESELVYADEIDEDDTAIVDLDTNEHEDFAVEAVDEIEEELAVAHTEDEREYSAHGKNEFMTADTPEQDEHSVEDHHAFESVTADPPAPAVEEAPRYSFATSRPSGSENATFARADTTESLKDSLQSSAAAVGSTEDGQPYIAPFIRDDIDRSEQRQSERISSLRDDMSRQLSTIKSEQASRLDLMIAAIDRKLESLDRRHAETMKGADNGQNTSVHVNTLSEKVDRITSAIEGQGQRIRAITTILETRSAEVSQVHEEIKSMHGDVRNVRQDLGKTGEAVGAVKGEIDEIKENVGKLERAILDRAAQDSSTIHRLTDVIRGTLPDGSYQFGVALENGENADCLINFGGLREKVAIDAGFPMEAFHDLPSRDAVRRNLPQAKVSEDAFRRAILRSILEAADRCISPAETADSCLLFLPSEAAYTILHDRFPDLVRDSQRARVWLVSPSTLMGTLNLIRNLLPDADDIEARYSDAEEAESRRGEEEKLRQEVESLRHRASGLADELDRTRATLRDLISTSDRINAALDEEPIDVTELSGDDDDDIIEGLRFEGTPDWETPKKSESRGGVSSLFDEDRNDPLR